MKALVIYHERCVDGACAAWAARYHLHAAGHVVDLVPAYPMKMPDVVLPMVTSQKYDFIVCVDIAFLRADLDFIDGLTPNGCWVLDHHATSAEALKEYSHAVFDMKRSGAGLAWDEVPKIIGIAPLPRPIVVDYVEDRDLWCFTLPFSHEVSEVIDLYLGTDIRAWAHVNLVLNTGSLKYAVDKGTALLKAKERDVACIIEDVSFVTIDGTECGVVTSPIHQSEIGNAIVTKHKVVGVVWFTKGTVAQVSFRSDDTLRAASALATSLGGGGHRNAAGAQVDLKKWIDILTAAS